MEMADIYFTENYARLYEKIEKGKTETIFVENEYGKIVSHVLKREIQQAPGYFDIVSPYGYGGPVILEITGDKKALVASYYKKMEEYVRDHHIVSEFVRFHPVFHNALDFQDIYNPVRLRHTVGTDLSVPNPLNDQFSKKCRKDIRRALKQVTYKVTEKPGDLNSFKQIYYTTMDRNHAGGYYYFSDAYFNDCLKYFRENLLLIEVAYEGTVIAAGMYFTWNPYIHAHLSGTLTEYLHLSPACVLKYALTEWGINNGYKLIHHGGGKSNDEEDTLLAFKKKFGKCRYDFYIGKKIWDEAMYQNLCKGMEATDFFPGYRER